jgi:hypothetical protein
MRCCGQEEIAFISTELVEGLSDTGLREAVGIALHRVLHEVLEGQDQIGDEFAELQLGRELAGACDGEGLAPRHDGAKLVGGSRWIRFVANLSEPDEHVLETRRSSHLPSIAVRGWRGGLPRSCRGRSTG